MSPFDFEKESYRELKKKFLKVRATSYENFTGRFILSDTHFFFAGPNVSEF